MSSGALGKATNRLLTWGCNVSGALGRGTIGLASNEPDYVFNLPDDPPVQVATGWGHTAFVTKSGQVIVCGRAVDIRNTLTLGRVAEKRPRLAYFWTHYLGAKNSIDFPEPTLMSSDIKATKISASACLTLGIDVHGNGFGFGMDRFGQTGTNITTERGAGVYELTKIALDSKLIDIAAGHQNGLAVTENGEVYGWGKADRGQIGCGDNSLRLSLVRKPMKIESLSHEFITSVSSGFAHCIALTNEGKVYHWGTIQSSKKESFIAEPRLIENLPPVVEAVCGQFQVVIRDVEGNVYQWGLRPDAMGSGFVERPVKVRGVPVDAKNISCGMDFASILHNGIPYVWDWVDLTAKPLEALDGYKVKQVAFGWRHNAAIVEESNY